MSLIYIPAWKYVWTFLSFTVPVFMLRAVAHQDRIKEAQKRLRISMGGIRSRFKTKHTSTVFWVSAGCLLLGAVVGDEHWFTNYVATPLALVAIAIPVLAGLARFTLRCRSARQTTAGRKFGAIARLYLLSAIPRK
jgi:hypothetical protein